MVEPPAVLALDRHLVRIERPNIHHPARLVPLDERNTAPTKKRAHHHALAPGKRSELFIRRVMQDAVERVSFDRVASILRLAEHLKRQAGDRIRDEVDRAPYCRHLERRFVSDGNAGYAVPLAEQRTPSIDVRQWHGRIFQAGPRLRGSLFIEWPHQTTAILKSGFSQGDGAGAPTDDRRCSPRHMIMAIAPSILFSGRSLRGYTFSFAS
ncbi:hypothetical protein D3C87_1258110 [compost metagenome]